MLCYLVVGIKRHSLIQTLEELINNKCKNLYHKNRAQALGRVLMNRKFYRIFFKCPNLFYLWGDAHEKTFPVCE